MTDEQFADYAKPWIENSYLKDFDYTLVCKLIRSRIEYFGEIPEKLKFLVEFDDFDNSLYENQKQKTDAAVAKDVLPLVRDKFAQVETWDNQHLYEALIEIAQTNGLKNGKILWPARIALTGLAATPGGASEIAELLGKEETLRRLDKSISRL